MNTKAGDGKFVDMSPNVRDCRHVWVDVCMQVIASEREWKQVWTQFVGWRVQASAGKNVSECRRVQVGT